MNDTVSISRSGKRWMGVSKKVKFIWTECDSVWYKPQGLQSTTTEMLAVIDYGIWAMPQTCSIIFADFDLLLHLSLTAFTSVHSSWWRSLGKAVRFETTLSQSRVSTSCFHRKTNLRASFWRSYLSCDCLAQCCQDVMHTIPDFKDRIQSKRWETGKQCVILSKWTCDNLINGNDYAGSERSSSHHAIPVISSEVRAPPAPHAHTSILMDILRASMLSQQHAHHGKSVWSRLLTTWKWDLTWHTRHAWKF